MELAARTRQSGHGSEVIDAKELASKTAGGGAVDPGLGLTNGQSWRASHSATIYYGGGGGGGGGGSSAIPEWMQYMPQWFFDYLADMGFNFEDWAADGYSDDMFDYLSIPTVKITSPPPDSTPTTSKSVAPETVSPSAMARKRRETPPPMPPKALPARAMRRMLMGRTTGAGNNAQGKSLKFRRLRVIKRGRGTETNALR